MLLRVAEIGSSSHLRINLATTLSKCSHTQVLGRSATVKIPVTKSNFVFRMQWQPSKVTIRK